MEWWLWLAGPPLAALIILIAIIVSQYRLGRRQQRLVVWGDQNGTYVRFYPNPGVSLIRRDRRFALSTMGGLEAYRRDERWGWRIEQRRWSRRKG